MINSEKVGLVYDERLLKHRSKRKHPEKAVRIKALISGLEEKLFLTHPKVDFLQNISFIPSESELLLVHKEKYIKHIKNLWPKTSHRTSMTVLDSYFNQYSEECARIAVGGVLQAIDNIMNSKWKSAFAAVRPPGHHSGARNTINGFCIYNSIAIGAKYLSKKYKMERVAIIDWDVHHGDGSQHIFKEDKNVLLISIHRYDRGTFYPASEEGSVLNQGEGEGKGFSVNINLDFVDEKFKQYEFQSPGDNDYIYIYHRIILPILSVFDPQFILVSCGFDAARGDPLGGFTLTPNGYYYLTKRLTEQNKPLLLVLQGGYNLNSIAESVCGVMKGLLGQQQFPEKIEVSEREMRKCCFVNSIIHDQLDFVIDTLSENWPILQSENYKHYTTMVKMNTDMLYGVVEDEESSSGSSSSEEDEKEEGEKEKGKCLKKYQQLEDEKDNSVTNQFYFAAGHMQRFKNFSPENPQILKWAHQEEIEFYEQMTVEQPFTPKYFGKENSYLILQNLLYQEHQPIVIDIKMSRQSKNPTLSQQRQQKQKNKELKSTSHEKGFRISGYTTPTFKEGGLLTKDENLVRKILLNVVTADNKEYFCSFLQSLATTLKGIKKHYFGTSIVLMKGKNKQCIRWVDFHYWIKETEEADHSMIEGVKNLKKFIEEIDCSEGHQKE